MTTHASTSFIHGRRGRWRTFLATVAAASVWLCTSSSAWAVSTSGSTYASKATGPAPLTDSDSHSAGNPTSASSSSRSDANSTSLNSHAQSWATAKIVGGVLTKTASGKTFVEAGNDTKTGTWYSYASGTTLQVNSAVVQPVQMLLRISRATSPAILGLDERPQDTNPLLPSMPEPFDALSDSLIPNPHQQLYVDSIGSLPGNPNPSFFDIFVDLKSSFSQGGPKTPLLNGSAIVDHEVNNVAFNQSFVDVNGLPRDVFTAQPPVSMDGVNRHFFNVEADVVVPFQVQTNSPFDVQTDMYLTMGYPDGLAHPFDPIIEALLLPTDFGPGLPRPVGGAGSLIVELLIDPNQQNIGQFGPLTIVPEPSSALLALMSVAGLAAFRRRRRSFRA